MYRQSIIAAARPALRLQSSAAIRTFTTTQRIMAEGDLGATRASGYEWILLPHSHHPSLARMSHWDGKLDGGVRGKDGHANWRVYRGDAFTKREKANEDYTVRQREKEKLLELKKKLAEQQQHLKQLEDHM